MEPDQLQDRPPPIRWRSAIFHTLIPRVCAKPPDRSPNRLDKLYCVYIAPNAEAVKELAKRGEFPANSIAQVRSIIGPTTAE